MSGLHKLATAKARSSDVMTQKPVASKEGALSWDMYEPGDSISTDQFVVKTPGRLIKVMSEMLHTIVAMVEQCFKILPPI